MNIECVKFNKIGMEIENNFNFLSLKNFVKILESGFIKDVSYENQCLFELRTKPISVCDFNEILEFIYFVNLIENYHVRGYVDYRAGSNHLHLSFPTCELHNSIVQEIEKRKINVVEGLCILSCKKIYERTFRDAVYGDDICCLFDSVGWNDKSSWITENKIDDEGDLVTLEFRINESAVPLWIYLIKNILVNETKELYSLEKELNDLFDEGFENFTSIKKGAEYVIEKIESEYSSDIINLVDNLSVWKDDINNFELFKDIMNLYIDESLKGKKTLKAIRDILEDDKGFNEKLSDIELRVYEDLDIEKVVEKYKLPQMIVFIYDHTSYEL